MRVQNQLSDLIVDLTAGSHRTEKEIGYRADIAFDLNPRDSRTVKAEWSHLPLPNQSASLVVFDPPHQVYGHGKKSWLVGRYSSFKNLSNAREILTQAFKEIRRILRVDGACLLKWSTNHRTLDWIVKLSGMEPLICIARPSLSSQPEKPFSHRATVFWVELRA